MQRLAGLRAAVDERLAAFAADDVGARLWSGDAALWKPTDEAHQRVIAESLGWLGVYREVRERLLDITAFVDEVCAEGYLHAVLLGMGGSSLAAEVLSLAFGAQPGYLDLTVLDTTDPAAIAAAESRLDLARTLFIVSSKSGGTTETASLHAYFHERTRAAVGDEDAGRHFIAITDEGTSREREALEQDFRAVFINADDVGGRYSALSFFGMIPAALAGADLAGLLESARLMAAACAPDVAAADNRGLVLGAALGELALAGRDKLTIVASPRIAGFGAWAEQLIAESTGKEGKGLFPVIDEPLGPPEAYGGDRAFVCVRLAGQADAAQDEALQALEDAAFPVVRLELAAVTDLGAQFLLWEIGVALAGAVLDIDPFDQPNVQESKDNTRRVLEEPEARGEAPLPAGAGGQAVAFALGDDGLEPALRQVLAGLEPPAYVALQAWCTPGDEARAELRAMRAALRGAHRVATSDGFGPRFLHSTGQYHKGGPAHGVFLQLVSEGGPELPVPGSAYTFAQLKHAQALGDLEALLARGGRVLRVDLGEEPVAGLRAFRELLSRVLAA